MPVEDGSHKPELNPDYRSNILIGFNEQFTKYFRDPN